MNEVVPAWIDQYALELARLIEDEFAKGHLGGVVGRRAAIQVLVTAAMMASRRDRP